MSSISTKKIMVQLDDKSNIELRKFTYGDIEDLYQLTKETQDSKDFFINVIHNQLKSPNLTIKNLKSIPDRQLKKIGKIFLEKNEFLQDARDEEPKFFNSFESIIKNKINNFSKLFNKLEENIEVMTGIFEEALNVIEEQKNILEGIDKAGLPSNLGENRSHSKLSKYRELLKNHYAIFFIPRTEIVEKLLKANCNKQRKNILLDNDKEILDDCVDLLRNIDKSYFNEINHLKSAINVYRKGEYRAAQSTAAVCLDAQLNYFVDISKLNKKDYREVKRKIRKKVQNIIHNPLDNTSVSFLFAALQLELLNEVLFTSFNRIKGNEDLDFSRHSSIHSVKKSQYNKANAIQSIMSTSSLLATIDKLGEGWIINKI